MHNEFMHQHDTLVSLSRLVIRTVRYIFDKWMPVVRARQLTPIIGLFNIIIKFIKTSEMIHRFAESNNKKYLFVTGKAEENGQYSYRIATFDWTRPWDVTPGDRRSEWVNQALITFPIDSVLRRFCLN